MDEVFSWAIVGPDNIVRNVCLWTGDESVWTPPAGCTMVKLPEGVGANPGYVWDGLNFSNPDTP